MPWRGDAATIAGMFLSRVEIHYLRGFEELQLDLHPRLTVLVGPNGCGKTTVLEAIVAALSGVLTAEHPGALLSRGSGGVRVVASSGADATAHLHRDAPRGRQHWNSNFHQLAVHYGASRHAVDRTPGPMTPRVWQGHDARNDWWDAGIAFDDFFAWLREREDLENERVRDGHGELLELRAFRDAVGRFADGFSNPRIRRSLPGVSNTPVFTVEKHGVERPFSAFSEGERNLILLVADIARRMAIFAAPKPAFDVPALILIDEIELHLHPKWQREILGRLLHVFPNAQFVVTTHSPIVVSEIERENLRVLNDFKLVTTEHGRGRDVNQVLEDTFGVSIRTREVEEKFREIKGLVDDENYDAALEALDELEKEIGDEPDVVYYRTLATRFRAASVHE